MTKTDTTDTAARVLVHTVQGPPQTDMTRVRVAHTRRGPADVSGVLVPCADGPAGFVGVDYGPRLRIRPERGHVCVCAGRVETLAWTGAGPMYHNKADATDADVYFPRVSVGIAPGRSELN